MLYQINVVYRADVPLRDLGDFLGRAGSLLWNRAQFAPVLLASGEMFGGQIMDKQRMEGGLKKATGTVKEKAGQMTGDRDLEAEGKVDKGEGRSAARSATSKTRRRKSSERTNPCRIRL